MEIIAACPPRRGRRWGNPEPSSRAPVVSSETPGGRPAVSKCGRSKMMTDMFWLFATAGGAAVLGIALAYALLLRQPLSYDEKRAQERKVKQLYGEGGK
jgi:hypothetical protein